MKSFKFIFVIIGLFLTFSLSNAQKQRWIWQNPLPQGNDLFDSFFPSKDIGFMVGKAGTILKTKDGGKNWTSQESNTRADLLAVHFNNDSLGIAVGEDGTILLTHDCGTTWEKLNSGRKDTLRGVSILTPKKIICVGDTGTIIRSDDGGKSWVYTPFPNFKSNLNGVFFPSPDFGAIVGDSFPPFGSIPIIISEDSGASFQPLGPSDPTLIGLNINNVWLPKFDPNKAILVGDKGVIIGTKDKGQTWTDYIIPVTVDIQDIWFFDDKNGFATGPNGTLLRTTDCGDTWIQINLPPPTNGDIITVAFPDSNVAYLGGSNGLLLGTNDGGNSFTNFLSGFRPQLNEITFLDDSFGIAAGPLGATLRTTNGGQTWQQPLLPFTFFDLESVTTTRKSDQRDKFWLAGGTFGDSARIFNSCDQGLTWDPQPIPSPFKLFDITFLDSLLGFAVGLNGAIYCTRDGGKNWVKKNGNTNNWLLDVDMPNDSTAYVAGGFGLILKTTDFGNSWIQQSSGTQEWLTSISFIDDSFGICAGNHGVILRTQDGGNNWEDISNPDEVDIDYTDISLFQRNFATNRSGQKDIGITLIGFEGKIYFSPDFGDTWILQNSPTKTSLWGCFFLDSLTGWAVGERGTILHTNGHDDPILSLEPHIQRPFIASLGSCFPNPAYQQTTIPFELKEAALVQLDVYNWAGTWSKSLINKYVLPGSYEEQLEVSNLPAGFYLYRLQVGNEVMLKRMIVIHQ